MSLRTPLARVLGLGSAKEGASHWWLQRVTAVALIPLTAWFTICLLNIESFDYGSISAWLAAPGHAVLLGLLVFALFYHSQLGLQVVIEDYVEAAAWKLAALLLSNFLHIALAVIALYSILRVAVLGELIGAAGGGPR